MNFNSNRLGALKNNCIEKFQKIYQENMREKFHKKLHACKFTKKESFTMKTR